MPTTYFKNIAEGIKTTAKGMRLTWRHLWAARKRRMPGDVRADDFFGQTEGRVTIQYPLETIPIPDNGRYRLHNEMDDCIVCDKCAKICPVDCIEIEPIRAIEEVGKASDGSPIRLYAAKFDIDMAKCCYCGLCTTVCPTECLTMTKTFDYSELDVRDMIYEFGTLTPAEADEKKRLLELFQAEKEALKAVAKAKPDVAPPIAIETEMKSDNTSVEKPKAPFKPVMKRPVIPAKKVPEDVEETKPEVPAEEKPKAPFRPTMKRPVIPVTKEPETVEENKADAPTEEKPKPKVPFRPTMKPPKPAIE